MVNHMNWFSQPRPVVFKFAYFEKAFDKIRWNKLWTVLRGRERETCVPNPSFFMNPSPFFHKMAKVTENSVMDNCCSSMSPFTHKMFYLWYSLAVHLCSIDPLLTPAFFIQDAHPYVNIETTRILISLLHKFLSCHIFLSLLTAILAKPQIR